MKKTSPSLLIGIVNLAILLLIILYLLFSQIDAKKEAYVYIDNVAVFSAFNLAKDLNARHQQQLTVQKKKVDSIVTVIQQNKTPDEVMQQSFVIANNKLKEMEQYFRNDVTQKVWIRLNDYASAFAQEHDYKILFGTQGSGNIMYAQEALNVTDAFIEYANNKYEGQ